MTNIAKKILTTLTFFDAQDLPLSLVEISANLSPSAFPPPFRGEGVPSRSRGAGEGAVALSDLTTTLQTELKDRVKTDGVFYCLASRPELLRQRHQRYRLTLTRMRRAKKYLSFLRHTPYVRAVAISGSQALLNSHPGSDIDLFIITGRGRIWAARLLVSLYFQIFGVRRHGQEVKNRFCLNHYLDESAAITEDKNFYTAVEYRSLLPVFGNFQKFYRQNLWIREFLPAARPESSVPFFRFQSRWLKPLLEAVLELTLLGPLLNLISGWYQRLRIRQQDYIFVSGHELSFHPGSRGQRILARFAEGLKRFD